MKWVWLCSKIRIQIKFSFEQVFYFILWGRDRNAAEIHKCELFSCEKLIITRLRQVTLQRKTITTDVWIILFLIGINMFNTDVDMIYFFFVNSFKSYEEHFGHWFWVYDDCRLCCTRLKWIIRLWMWNSTRSRVWTALWDSLDLLLKSEILEIKVYCYNTQVVQIICHLVGLLVLCRWSSCKYIYLMFTYKY